MKTVLLMLPIILLSACTPKDETGFSDPEILPAIQLAISNASPKVGEQMDLTLRISAEERLLLPPLSEKFDPRLEVLETRSEIIRDDARWVQEQYYKLAIFQVTNLVVFADSTVQTLEDQPQEIDLPFQNIQVVSVLPENYAAPMLGEDTLPDFRGPEALKRQKRNLIISAVVGVLALIICGGIAWMMARRPKVLPPPVPPHLIVKKEIERLLQSEIWQRPDVDASAVALSFILRRYIEARFEIRAPEQTTEEFLELVENQPPWPAQEQTGLQQFFAVTDQIKFAGSRPGSEVLQDLLNAVRQFVESTQENEEAP
ncbi:hypothetical protein P0Y35_00715 [Kiritimatiellaeota bacterium B1221]|nr:hypothetical protein [Kiritimatiellaeota bacterium B1221]